MCIRDRQNIAFRDHFWRSNFLETYFRKHTTSCIIPPLFNMHGILWGSSWMKHTLAVRRSDVTRTYYKYTFDFLERRVLAPQTVGRLAVLIQCTVGAHTSCWAVGLMPTTICTSKTLRSTKSSVLVFVNVFFWGWCTPLLSSAHKIISYRNNDQPKLSKLCSLWVD